MKLLRLIGRMFKRVFREPYVKPFDTESYPRDRAMMDMQMRNF